MDQFYLDDEAAAPGRSWLRPLLVGTLALALVVAATFALRAFLAHPVEKGPGIRQIALVQPPPPPPKPPEKPPEPPKVKDEVKVDEPKAPPKPDDPKPADNKPSSDKPLGLDADGTAGADGFGLAGNKGGQDIVGQGSGGSGAYYSGLLQRAFFDSLSRNRDLLHEQFRIVVKVWLSDDGHVTRADIVNGSGNGDVDKQIQSALLDIAPLREVPPGAMRQIELRLSNRS